MTTPAKHLSIRNQVLTIRDYFNEHFSFDGCAQVAYNEVVNLDNTVEGPWLSAVSVYEYPMNPSSKGFLEITFFCITRREGTDGDPDGSVIMDLIDTIATLWRDTGGVLPLMDYSEVTEDGDEPEELPTSLLIRDRDEARGEPYDQTAITQEGNWNRCEIRYRFRLAESYASMDNI